MYRLTVKALILLTFVSGAASAQSSQPAPPEPMTAQSMFLHEGMKVILLRAAERMPEERYGYKPVDGVRNYGQLLGHIADMQFIYCAAILAEKPPMSGIERTRTTKPELIAALKEAGAYCDRVFVGMTDASGAQPATFMGSHTPRLSLMSVSYLHSALHYGNLVTYLRMNGIVPPTSDPGFLPQGSR